MLRLKQPLLLLFLLLDEHLALHQRLLLLLLRRQRELRRATRVRKPNALPLDLLVDRRRRKSGRLTLFFLIILS